MASISESKTGMRKQTSIADLIVKGAIALVTAAFFIGAYLQFQVTFWLALIAALSVYITLLMLHALMRRSERVDTLVSEVSRLEGEVARLKGKGGQAYAPPARGQRGPAAAPARSVKEAAGAPPAPAGKGVPPPREPALGAVRPAPQPAAAAPYPPAPAQSGGARNEPMHDYWSFRPSQAAPSEAGPAPRQERAPAARERETDLEAVQGMIKRLADELSLGVEQQPAGEAVRASQESAQETAMRASVDALQTTADTMRTAAKPGAEALPGAGAPAGPPPIAPTHSRLAAVGAAVAAERMDVLLEPIVGLADQQVHHFEMSVRPREENGDLLQLAAHDPHLSMTGLNPLIDGAKLRRAARLCMSAGMKDMKRCIFSSTSGESLTNERFLDQLANVYRTHAAVAGELVLTFSQADIRAFGGPEWSALTDMRDLGFRFGLDEVTDVDYEFTALRAAGFAFVKIEAANLLKGLQGPSGTIPAVDVCRQLGELGLAVIVGRIDDEATRAAVVECGVPLGQGQLFGPPRKVAEEGAAGSGIAAA